MVTNCAPGLRSCGNFGIKRTLCDIPASAILCYDCNSAYDPRCGEEFDSFSLGIVNCSLRDPPEHIPAVEPSICRSIKMEIYGKVRVVRQCGYLHEEDEVEGENICRRQTGNGELFVTYCSCDTDLCNAGIKQRNSAWFNVIAALLGIYCHICYY
nr:uncharacterized protein LOC128671101 isoform X2 [Plodia interpunctella]